MEKRKHYIIGRHIGNTVLDGPLSIIPPGQEHGWYGKDVSIRIGTIEENGGPPQMTGHECVSIWSDDTMNKDNDFFAPVIRHARWSLTGEKWPDITTSLAWISNAEELDQKLLDFQKLLKNLPYIPSGLSYNRSVPEAEFDPRYYQYTVFFRNGIQGIEFGGEPLQNDGFSENVHNLFTAIKSRMNIFDRAGWKEKYHSDFTAETENSPFYWDYSCDFPVL